MPSPPPTTGGGTAARRASMFPLPRDHFGHGFVSPEQAKHYRELANQRVAAALAAERALLPPGGEHGPPRLSVTRWKRVSNKGDMHIYRRRRRGRSLKALAREEDHEDVMVAVQGGTPSMVGIGRVEGAMEDLLFGWYSATHEELQATSTFEEKHILDASVLAVVETAATPSPIADAKRKHPMQFIGLKWMCTKLPASLILAPRDWCYLNAMGVSTDPDGRRFGYCVLHSVDVPSCPPFDVNATGIVRGKMYQTFILRENSPGFVDVFSRCVYDPAGVASPKFAAYATSGALRGVARALRCAEAKKLTLLALRNRATADEGGAPVMDRCAVCYKRAGAVVGTMRWKQCRVCGTAVCSKCYAKKNIFVSTNNSSSGNAADANSELTLRTETVDCCTTCMIAAKNMTSVRPAEPEFSIVRSANGGEALFLTPLLGRSVASHHTSSIASSTSSGSPSGFKSIDFSDTGKTVSVADDRDDGNDSILYASDDFDSEVEDEGENGGDDVDVDDAAEVAAMVERIQRQTLDEQAGDLRHFGSSLSADASAIGLEPPKRRHRARPASTSSLMDQPIGSRSASKSAEADAVAKEQEKEPELEDEKEKEQAGDKRVDHQLYLLERMMALHNKAEEVYDMTRANQEMMMRSFGPK